MAQDLMPWSRPFDDPITLPDGRDYTLTRQSFRMALNFATHRVRRVTPMQEYNAYVLDDEGHIVRRIDLLCADEATAKDRAAALVDGHDIELWQLDHRIAVFRHKD